MTSAARGAAQNAYSEMNGFPQPGLSIFSEFKFAY